MYYFVAAMVIGMSSTCYSRFQPGREQYLYMHFVSLYFCPMHSIGHTLEKTNSIKRIIQASSRETRLCLVPILCCHSCHPAGEYAVSEMMTWRPANAATASAVKPKLN